MWLLQGDCHSCFMKFLSRSFSHLNLLECAGGCPLGFNSSCCEHAILPPRGGSDHHILQEVCVLMVTSEKNFSFLIPCVSLLSGLYKSAHGTPQLLSSKQGAASLAVTCSLPVDSILHFSSQALLSLTLPLPGTGLACSGWGTEALGPAHCPLCKPQRALRCVPM